MNGVMTQEAKWAAVVKKFQYYPELLTSEIKEKFLAKTLTPEDLQPPAWHHLSSRNLRACMNADGVGPLGWE